MKKKLTVLGITASILASSMLPAFAENTKATEYKNMLAAKNYYVEYQDVGGKKTLAVQGNKRMSFATKYNPDTGLSAMSLIPFVGLFSMFGSKDTMQPNIYYENGKFYQFISKNEARVATEAELKDPCIDPKEGWTAVKQRVSLPAEFNVFGVIDDFANNNVLNYKNMQYVESGKETVEKKELDFDKYVLPIKSVNGNILWENVYYVYYDDNGLCRIKTCTKKNGEEKDLQSVNIMKFVSEIPENKINLPNGSKLYKAGLGDMDDFLDNNVPIDN